MILILSVTLQILLSVSLNSFLLLLTIENLCLSRMENSLGNGIILAVYNSQTNSGPSITICSFGKVHSVRIERQWIPESKKECRYSNPPLLPWRSNPQGLNVSGCAKPRKMTVRPIVSLQSTTFIPYQKEDCIFFVL